MLQGTDLNPSSMSEPLAVSLELQWMIIFSEFKNVGKDEDEYSTTRFHNMASFNQRLKKI